MTDLTPSSTSAAPPKAGTAPTLSPEDQLSGDMLMLTSGFMMCAAMLWLAIYWSMGYQYSTAIPLIFQGELYATVSMVAGVVYYLGLLWGLPGDLMVIVAILLGFALRVLALVFHWEMPKFVYDREMRK